MLQDLINWAKTKEEKKICKLDSPSPLLLEIYLAQILNKKLLYHQLCYTCLCVAKNPSQSWSKIHVKRVQIANKFHLMFEHNFQLLRKTLYSPLFISKSSQEDLLGFLKTSYS